MPSVGFVLCIASAIGFGAMGIFGKLAYDDGVTVGTLLSVRFVLAAMLFWLLIWAMRLPVRLSRRDLAIGLALGAVGYAGQAGAYFGALHRLDAGLLCLIVYAFPAIVAVAAVLLKRERWSNRTGVALTCALGGLVLVVAGAGTGVLDGPGVAMAIVCAVGYASYILCSVGIAGRTHPLVLSALVCTGAAVSLTAGSATVGDLHLGAVGSTGWLTLAAIASVSTVGGIGLFFAGMPRIGATKASIVSTAEPMTAVVLAFLAFGESLGPLQFLGAALIVAAVLVTTGSGLINHNNASAPKRLFAGLWRVRVVVKNET